jgi:phage terminase Nu1 subunit (DNA packaging protein)
VGGVYGQNCETRGEVLTEEKQNLAEIARKKRHLYLIQKLNTGNLTKPEIKELEEFEKGDEKRVIVKTLDELQEVMNVSERTLFRWKKEGMPVTKEGFYDLEEISEWYKTKVGLIPADESEGKFYWQELILKCKARLLEIEVAKAQGELMPRKEVEQGWAMRVSAVRAEFTALPDRVAPILAMKEPREIKKLLLDAIIEITDEFAGVKK